jgi:hypothetical protein
MAIWSGSEDKESTAKVLIEYHADIHQPAQYKTNKEYDPSSARHYLRQEADADKTPLQSLIDTRAGAVINHTLMWCPDQWKGVNEKGENALHAVSASDCRDSMHFLIRRGVNPLALTKNGHSVLSYALDAGDATQTSLAECIALGLATHEHKITSAWENDTLQQRRTELLKRVVTTVLCILEKHLKHAREEIFSQGGRMNYELREVTRETLDGDLATVSAVLDECTAHLIQFPERYFNISLHTAALVDLHLDFLKMNINFSQSPTLFQQWLVNARKEIWHVVQKQPLINALGHGRVPQWMGGHWMGGHGTVPNPTNHFLHDLSGLTWTEMLFESGALSYQDLPRLGYMFWNFVRDTVENRRYPLDKKDDWITLWFERVIAFFEEKASVPRTLQSLSRLVISRYLDVRGRRQKEVESLNLTSEMKNYVMFSDVTDPGFGNDPGSWKGQLLPHCPRYVY